jgi:uncharacterized Zn-binding protein involved in type VI secretion
MASVQRVGDTNSAGGVALGGGSSGVFVNGRSVVVEGTPVTAHTCCGRRGCAAHCGPVTTSGSRTVKVGGIPLIYTGSADTCGHPRVGGSPNVTVG